MNFFIGTSLFIWAFYATKLFLNTFPKEEPEYMQGTSGINWLFIAFVGGIMLSLGCIITAPIDLYLDIRNNFLDSQPDIK